MFGTGSNPVRGTKFIGAYMNKYRLDVKNCGNLEEVYSPIPLDVIPNKMGINLSNVDSIEWVKLEDGQLCSLTINFSPKYLELV